MLFLITLNDEVLSWLHILASNQLLPVSRVRNGGPNPGLALDLHILATVHAGTN